MELKPCKKCGFQHGRIIKYGHLGSKKITYRLSCPSCGYCTKEKNTVNEATVIWNTSIPEYLKKKDDIFNS